VNIRTQLISLFADVVSCVRCEKVECAKLLRDGVANLPQPGYVGKNYFNTRVLLIGQNPGGCSERKRLSDMPYMNALASLKAEASEKNWLELENLLETYIPKWPVHGQYFPLEECEFALGDIAYFNLTRCRTVENAPPNRYMIANCLEEHLTRWLEVLAPNVVVCVGKFAYDHLSGFVQDLNVPCDYIDRNRSLSNAKRKENADRIVALVRKHAGSMRCASSCEKRRAGKCGTTKEGFATNAMRTGNRIIARGAGKCGTTKEGFAMALTCFLDELGIKNIDLPKVRDMLENTCLPYKKDGSFLAEWLDGKKIYIHACREILDGNAKKIATYGQWVEKAENTLKEEGDMGQMFQALKTMKPQLTAEDFKRMENKVRARLTRLGGRI